jgi:glycosyltransferase involved in cell wall biosynthesis
MRILYVVPRYWPSIGGAQLVSRELVRRVADQHAVKVVTQFTSDADSFAHSVVSVRAGRYEDGPVTIERLALSAAWRPFLQLLTPFYGRVRPVNPVFGWLLRRALLPELLTIIREHRSEIVHAVHVGLVYSSETALAAARAAGIPFVWTPLPHIEGEGWRGPRFRRLYSQADALIAMTRRERAWLIEQGAAAERVQVIPIGPLLHSQSDPEGFRATHHLGATPLVLFLAQKLPYKGYRQVAEAAPLVWQRFPEARFAFIGPQTAESRRFFATQNDSRIIELPAVDDFTKSSALAACDIFCMPSVQESLGAVYLEAWSHRKPVIAANIEVMADVVTPGVDGLLVKPDSTAVADAIIALLRDPAQRGRMGAAGSHKVQEHYDWQRLAERVVGVYKDLIRAGG